MKIIKRYEEGKKLKKVIVTPDKGKNWTLQWDNGFYVFHGDNIEKFSKFLMKIHAKDNKKEPRSYRSLKYLDLAKEITNGIDTTIWVWEKDLKNIRNRNK